MIVSQLRTRSFVSTLFVRRANSSEWFLVCWGQQQWWFIRPAAGSDLCKFPSRKHSKAVEKRKREGKKQKSKSLESIFLWFWAKSKQRPFFSPPQLVASCWGLVQNKKKATSLVISFFRFQLSTQVKRPKPWLVKSFIINDGSRCWCAWASSTPLCPHQPSTITTWAVLRFVRPIALEDCPTETCHSLSYPSQVSPYLSIDLSPFSSDEKLKGSCGYLIIIIIIIILIKKKKECRLKGSCYLLLQELESDRDWFDE